MERKMYKLRMYILATILLSGLLFKSTNAALVELVVVGNIEFNGLVTVDQSVDSLVTIKAVYDTSFVDRDIANVDVGRFNDIPAPGETALIPFRLRLISA